MSINFFMRAYVSLLGLGLLASVAVAGTPRYGVCAVAALALLYLILDLCEGLRNLRRAEIEFDSYASRNKRASDCLDQRP